MAESISQWYEASRGFSATAGLAICVDF